jgi:hypothetical protein
MKHKNQLHGSDNRGFLHLLAYCEFRRLREGLQAFKDGNTTSRRILTQSRSLLDRDARLFLKWASKARGRYHGDTGA